MDGAVGRASGRAGRWADERMDGGGGRVGERVDGRTDGYHMADINYVSKHFSHALRLTHNHTDKQTD